MFSKATHETREGLMIAVAKVLSLAVVPNTATREGCDVAAGVTRHVVRWGPEMLKELQDV